MLKNLPTLDHVNVANSILEDVQVLLEGAYYSECAMVETLVLEVFHTNREQGLVNVLFFVVEKNALAFFHLCSPVLLLWFFPAFSLLVKQIEHLMDLFFCLSGLKCHQ